MNEPIKTFTNEETQMAAHVVLNTAKAKAPWVQGYNVVLQDLDSGEYLSSSKCGIQSLTEAEALAKKWAGV